MLSDSILSRARFADHRPPAAGGRTPSNRLPAHTRQKAGSAGRDGQRSIAGQYLLAASVRSRFLSATLPSPVLSILCGGNHHTTALWSPDPRCHVYFHTKRYLLNSHGRAQNPTQVPRLLRRPWTLFPGRLASAGAGCPPRETIRGCALRWLLAGKAGQQFAASQRAEIRLCCEGARRRLQKSDLGACAMPLGHDHQPGCGGRARLRGRCTVAMPPTPSRSRPRDPARPGLAAAVRAGAAQPGHPRYRRMGRRRPGRIGSWAADAGQCRSRRKSRMDARTRERLPVLPTLVSWAVAERGRTAELLAAAEPTRPGSCSPQLG